MGKADGADKRLILEIKASRVLLEDSLKNSGVAVSQQDLKLRYTHFTNSHRGMASENLIGKTDADWLPPPRSQEVDSH